MTSTSQERIPKRLIGAIVAVGSLAFIGILTETVMTVLFPELMTEFGVNTATVQWITTVYLLVVAATMPLSSFLNRRFRLKSLFIAAVVLGRDRFGDHDRRPYLPGHPARPRDPRHRLGAWRRR